MRRTLASVVALAWAALAADPAAAAKVEGFPDDRASLASVEVTDPGGERNRLAISAPYAIIVRELGSAPLEAAGTCRAVGPRVVRCPEAVELSVRAGAGDDRVTILAAQGLGYVGIAGGRGDDRLHAGAAAGFLIGGRGRDLLLGGDRGDFLLGGPGEDRLVGRDLLDGDAPGDAVGLIVRHERESADDVLDGGPGIDTASWAGRRSPVRADVRRERVGSAVDSDGIRSIESLAGTRGADRLVATPGRTGCAAATAATC